MSNKFTELTIDEFYQKEMFNEINIIIHNGIYYYDISDFKKIKTQMLQETKLEDSLKN